MDVLESLLNHPLIVQNKELEALIILLILLTVSYPILKVTYNVFINLIGATNKRRINEKINEHINIFTNKLRNSAKNRTKVIISLSDKFYFFSSRNSLSIFFIKYFSFWSWKSFIVSWIFSLLYLTISLFFVGYYEFTKDIWEEFVFLVFFYILILILFNTLFNDLHKKSSMKNILLLGFVFSVCIIGIYATRIMTGAFIVAIVIIGISVAILAVVRIFYKFKGLNRARNIGKRSINLSDRIRTRIKKAIVENMVIIIVGVAIITIAIILIDLIQQNNSFVHGNIFSLLEEIPNMSYKQAVLLFLIFFTIMPLVNASLDSLSLAVSRREFEELQNSNYTLKDFIKISLIDFTFAIFFKILVLGMLYLTAFLLHETGGTFSIIDISNYYEGIKSIIFNDEKLSFLIIDTTNTMITLMISTTLIPSIMHFLLVSINVFYIALANILDIIKILFMDKSSFIAMLMSAVCLSLPYYWVLSYIKI